MGRSRVFGAAPFIWPVSSPSVDHASRRLRLTARLSDLEADAFLVSVGYTGPSGTYTLTSDQRDHTIDLKDALDTYNNGLGC